MTAPRRPVIPQKNLTPPMKEGPTVATNTSSSPAAPVAAFDHPEYNALYERLKRLHDAVMQKIDARNASFWAAARPGEPCSPRPATTCWRSPSTGA